MKKLAVIAALALTISACSSDSSEPAPQPVEPASDTASSTDSATPATEALMVQPRNGLQDPHPVKWESATPGADDMSLVVTWWSRPEGCVGLDDTEVVYGGGSIGVDIIEGSVRTDEPCPNDRVLKSTTITLVQPVQGRDIRPLSVI